MDNHSHICRTCGKIWTHDGDELQKLDKAGYDAAHVCCGVIQRNRFNQRHENSGLALLFESLFEEEEA